MIAISKEGKVYNSLDNGKKWNIIEEIENGYRIIPYKEGKSEDIVILSNKDLYFSYNCGKSILKSNINNNSIENIKIHPKKPYYVLASILKLNDEYLSRELYLTTNSGKNWSHLKSRVIEYSWYIVIIKGISI